MPSSIIWPAVFDELARVVIRRRRAAHFQYDIYATAVLVADALEEFCFLSRRILLVGCRSRIRRPSRGQSQSAAPKRPASIPPVVSEKSVT
jgi:hypothetical protein